MCVRIVPSDSSSHRGPVSCIQFIYAASTVGPMEVKVCGNCGEAFEPRPGGRSYKRHSLENKLPNSDVTAKDALERLTSATFTPIKSTRQGNFLCTACWTTLSNAHRYQQLSTSFLGKTLPSGYLGTKLKDEPKEFAFDPRATSTPQKEEGRPGSRKTLFPVSSVKAPGKTKQYAKWTAIANAAKNRKYGTAVRGLYHATQGSRRHFLNVVKKEVRREVKSLLASDVLLCQKADIASLEQFSWENVFNLLGEKAPLLSAVLKSAATAPKNEPRMTRGEKGTINIMPYVGTSLSCLLFAKSPVASFLPVVISLQLWRGGLKRETINQLSRLGICLGEKGTLSAVDRLRKSFDAAAATCKSQVEKQLALPQSPIHVEPDYLETSRDMSLALSAMDNMEHEVNEPSDLEDNVEQDECGNDEEKSSSSSESSSDGEEKSDREDESDNDSTDDIEPEFATQEVKDVVYMETDELEMKAATADFSEPLHPGYTFCWDNVGKKVTTRHPSPDKQNTYINFALGYLAVNRVSSTHLDYQDSSTVPASSLPVDTFIPGEEDFHEVRSRMEIIVSRILTRHLKWFNVFMDDCVTRHLIHEHSVESSQRSLLVNLGVFEENPSTTEGAIGIYQRFQKYIPEVNGQPIPTLIFGDGLSCERGNDALKARCNGATKKDRLEGMQPAAQEFHKEMILLQDHYDKFFSGTSAAERGTLYNVKNLLNFRNVKLDVSENFTHSWELMCQTTESLVCLASMEILKMKESHERPPTAPTDLEACSVEERRKYLEDTAKKVVDMLWHHMDTATLTKESSESSGYCCDSDKDEDLIRCDNRNNCQRGEWFHVSCSGVDPENLPGEWYCCQDCRAISQQQYPFCFCGKDLGRDVAMIGCSAGDRCTQKQWYHLECIGLTEDDIPEGDWCCCGKCNKLRPPSASRPKKRKKTKVATETYVPDFKYRHNVAMAFSGLNLLVRRDAVREADGHAMMSHWLIDLVHFFRTRHVKYVILAHRLIAAINGWLPEKIAQEIRWNRTVNYSGGIGRNLPADLMNEIFNRLFKDLLKDARGHYTSLTLARCSQMIGPLGEALDVVFDSKIIEHEVYRHRRRNANRDDNVKLLTKLTADENLFRVVPGRTYRAFPAFEYTLEPKFPGRYLPKMKQLSGRLDKLRRVQTDC